MLVPYSKLESCTLFFPSLNLHYIKDYLLFLLVPIKGHSQTRAFFKSTVLCCSYVSYFSPVTLSNKSYLLLLILTFVLILVSTHIFAFLFICLEFC